MDSVLCEHNSIPSHFVSQWGVSGMLCSFHDISHTALSMSRKVEKLWVHPHDRLMACCAYGRYGGYITPTGDLWVRVSRSIVFYNTNFERASPADKCCVTHKADTHIEVGTLDSVYVLLICWYYAARSWKPYATPSYFTDACLVLAPWLVVCHNSLWELLMEVHAFTRRWTTLVVFSCQAKTSLWDHDQGNMWHLQPMVILCPIPTSTNQLNMWRTSRNRVDGVCLVCYVKNRSIIVCEWCEKEMESERAGDISFVIATKLPVNDRPDYCSTLQVIGMVSPVRAITRDPCSFQSHCSPISSNQE